MKTKFFFALRDKTGTENDPFKRLNIVFGFGDRIVWNVSCSKFFRVRHGYLIEVQYRFNRRVNTGAMLLRMALTTALKKPCFRRNILMLVKADEVTQLEDL